MEKIIQRDFFPDLEKLKAQNEYLDAVERNDVIKIRDMHLKYSGRRPPTERVPSPATFETPVIHRDEQPNVATTQPATETKESQLTLDQYLNVHTSEDNQSFGEIMVEAERKHREKYAYLYNEESKTVEEQKKLLALPSIERQCELPEKKLNVDGWGYKNRNYIMYIPDGVGPTPEELVEMSKKRQEIKHANTRLTVSPFNEQQNKEAISELAKSQAKVKDGKIGVDGKEVVTETPKIRGYGFLRTPSPSPGRMDASPFMTWGEIEGTPFLLDGSDTPIRRSAGPAFKIAEPPRREQLAHALAEKAGERHRDQKLKAIQTARQQLSSPSPKGSEIDRLASMSPAARRLATSKLRISGSTDLALRASYSPRPSPRPDTNPITPRSQRSATPRSGITDNLLNIPVTKRNKASDFF